jgi:hypothetical protein
MTLWELAACVDGYNKAHSAPVVENVPQEELDKMIEQIKKNEQAEHGGQ